jgi:hypothetical protein
VDKRKFAFWKNVDDSDTTHCWEWRAGKTQSGYGHCKAGRGYAHRRAYELFYNGIDNSLDVLHKCNNPSCCNPYHLYQGTQKDNVADREKRFKEKGDIYPNRKKSLENMTTEKLVITPALLIQPVDLGSLTQ